MFDLPFIFVSVMNLVFVLGLLLNMAGMLTWVERKQAAVMANRIGANRAYIPFPVLTSEGIVWSRRFTFIGLFHAIADGLKMLVKEDFTPPFVDRAMFNLAPWFAVVPVLVSFAVVPFGGPFQPGVIISDLLGGTPVGPLAAEFFGERIFQMQLADLNVGLLFIFAIGGTGIFSCALAGWSSGNKFSLMGGLRASSQMISYEVFMGMSILGLIVCYGTVSMSEIAQIQGDFWKWGIVLQPHMFLVFGTALMAENKRTPFDMPEAESELVAGYFTEYSAMKMGLFMMAEFIEIAAIAGILTALFFGAYQVPGLHGVNDLSYWATHPDLVPGNVFFGTEVPQVAVVVLRVLSFLLKVVVLCWIQVLIRWTLPKFRYDQVMRLGWKILLPISIVNLVVTALVVAALP